MNTEFWYNMNKINPPMCLTHEQFYEIMKPIICEICRKIFNPTNEEIEEAKLILEEIDKSIFEWEIIKE